MTINDVSVPREGDSGSHGAIFAVRLSGATPRRTSVRFTTVDAPATSPAAYAATAGTLAFAPGETERTITVPIQGDTEVEPNPSFSVALSEPVDVVIEDASGLGPIIDDDVGASGFAVTRSMNASRLFCRSRSVKRCPGIVAAGRFSVPGKLAVTVSARRTRKLARRVRRERLRTLQVKVSFTDRTGAQSSRTYRVKLRLAR